jgi:hypothetical protein
MALLENDMIFRALSVMAIEKSLLNISKQAYDKVTDRLTTVYDCYLPDCYDHPEYLSEILKKSFGNSHRKIIESINTQLEEFAYQKPVERFLKIINT